MCQAAVDEGGYELAWYARRVDGPERRTEKLATSRKHADYVEAINVDWSDGPFGLGPTGTAIRTGEPVIIGDMAADQNFTPWVGEAAVHGFRSCMALPVIVDGNVDGCSSVYASEPHAFAGDAADLMKDLASELGFGLKRLRDHELLLKSLKDQTLLQRQSIRRANRSSSPTRSRPSSTPTPRRFAPAVTSSRRCSATTLACSRASCTTPRSTNRCGATCSRGCPGTAP